MSTSLSSYACTYAPHLNFVAGLATTGAWIWVTTSLPFDRWRGKLYKNVQVHRYFGIFNYAATVYQIATHWLTGLKYLGFTHKYLPVPGGTKDVQSLSDFTFHNAIDIGNLLCMIWYGVPSPLVYHTLLAFHLSSSCMAFWNFNLFQTTVLMDIESPMYVRIFKTSLVLTDSLLRSYALYKRYHQ